MSIERQLNLLPFTAGPVSSSLILGAAFAVLLGDRLFLRIMEFR